MRGKNKILACQGTRFELRENKEIPQEMSYCLAYFKANLQLIGEIL
jgi:hypothetical protein